VSDTDRCADIYSNFEDRQQWFTELFESMTHAEYIDFVGYCFKELDLAADAKDGGEFRRVKGLILALARKDLEVAYFMDGLTEAQRATALKAATSYYELAKRFYPADAVPAVEAAWAESLDYASRFGWPSVAFDILAPRRVFRDLDSGGVNTGSPSSAP
jgi:hypothetical protein